MVAYGQPGPLTRDKVDSTDIESVGYDSILEIMDVKFRKSGRVVRYYNVGAAIYDGLMAAGTSNSNKKAASAGSFMARYVRNRYTHRDITDWDDA